MQTFGRFKNKSFKEYLNPMKSKIKSTKGFTLMELIVAIVIVAIIAGLAVANNDRVVDEAKVAEMKAEAGRLNVAISNFSMFDKDYINEKISGSGQCKAWEEYTIANSSDNGCSNVLKPSIITQNLLIQRGYLGSPIKWFSGNASSNMASTWNGEHSCQLTYKKSSLVAATAATAIYGIEITGCDFFPDGFKITTLE